MYAVLRPISHKMVSIWEKIYINVYVKEGKNLHFPDFLGHSDEYLLPNQVSMTELSYCQNR